MTAFLSLLYILINSDTKSLMFQNASITLITLKRGMANGRAMVGGMELVVMIRENID